MKQLHPRIIWIFFLKYFTAWFLVFLVPVFVLGPVYIDSIKLLKDRLVYILIIIFIALLLFILISYITAKLEYRFYRYELTDNTYKSERGIIWKKYSSIPYKKIQNVDIRRGLLTRLLGLSDIQIYTAGYGGSGSIDKGSEGRLPGLGKKDAETIRDELINRTKNRF